MNRRAVSAALNACTEAVLTIPLLWLAKENFGTAKKTALLCAAVRLQKSEAEERKEETLAPYSPTRCGVAVCRNTDRFSGSAVTGLAVSFPPLLAPPPRQPLYLCGCALQVLDKYEDLKLGELHGIDARKVREKFALLFVDVAHRVRRVQYGVYGRRAARR